MVLVGATVAVLLTACSSKTGGGPAQRGLSPEPTGPSTPVATISPTRTEPSRRGLVPADFQGQPARPCAEARPGQEISFRIEPDVPQPSCWKVGEFRSVRIVNATGDFGQQPVVVTGSLTGTGRFRLEPGAGTTLRLPHGMRFAPGDHCVTVSLYRGSCLAIWLFDRAA